MSFMIHSKKAKSFPVALSILLVMILIIGTGHLAAQKTIKEKIKEKKAAAQTQKTESKLGNVLSSKFNDDTLNKIKIMSQPEARQSSKKYSSEKILVKI